MLISLLLLFSNELGDLAKLDANKFKIRHLACKKIESKGWWALPTLLAGKYYDSPSIQDYSNKLIISILSDSWLDKDLHGYYPEYGYGCFYIDQTDDVFERHQNLVYIYSIYYIGKFTKRIYFPLEYYKQSNYEYSGEELKTHYLMLFKELKWSYR